MPPRLGGEPAVPPWPLAPPVPELPAVPPPPFDPPEPMVPPVPLMPAAPAPPGPIVPPVPPLVPLLMVLPAWPPLAVPPSAMLFRPELLHAIPTRPATKRAVTAVGILNIWFRSHQLVGGNQFWQTKFGQTEASPQWVLVTQDVPVLQSSSERQAPPTGAPIGPSQT